MELRTQLASEFGLELPATVTFDHPTAAALAAFIAAELSQTADLALLSPGRLSVAGSGLSWSAEGGSSTAANVEGVSGRWPGSHAGGVAGFWETWRTQTDLPQVCCPCSTEKQTTVVQVVAVGWVCCQDWRASLIFAGCYHFAVWLEVWLISGFVLHTVGD